MHLISVMKYTMCYREKVSHTQNETIVEKLGGKELETKTFPRVLRKDEQRREIKFKNERSELDTS